MRLNADTYVASRVVVSMEGNVQEYALNFLNIFNNVRENSELISVTNDYGNNVYVVCENDSVDDTKKYLSNFGEIVRVDKVLCVSIDDIDYDYDKYEGVVILPYED